MCRDDDGMREEPLGVSAVRLMPFYVEVPLPARPGQAGGVLGISAPEARELSEEKHAILAQVGPKRSCRVSAGHHGTAGTSALKHSRVIAGHRSTGGAQAIRGEARSPGDR